MREDVVEWNEWVLARGGSFLQSWEWGAFQERLGKNIRRFAFPKWRGLMLTTTLPLGLSYGYMPYGPVLARPDDFSSWKSFLNDAESVCAKERIIFLRIEPRGAPPIPAEREALRGFMRRLGYRKTAQVQPEITAFIDLRRPAEELLRVMEHETRYAIRAADRRGVRIKRCASREEKERAFPLFVELVTDTSARHGLRTYGESYYRALLELDPPSALSTELLIAYVGGDAAASALIAYFGGSATYLYAASRAGFGRYNAPSRLVWEAMRIAKERGASMFDLWGISHTDERWRGVTAFKQSFGGEDVCYAGTWDFPLRRNWYYFYRMAKRLRR